MNNNDLAALAALGAMGAWYKSHLDSLGTGQGAPADAAGRYPPAADFVNRDSSGGVGGIRARDVVYGGDNTARDAGAAIAGENRDLAGAQRANSGVGLSLRGGNEQRYRDRSGGKGGGGAPIVSFTGNGSGYDRPFLSGAVAPDVAPDAAPEESDGMGGALRAGITAAGLGTAGLAGSYYAKVKREARLADERAKRVAEARAGILKDQTQERIAEDRAGSKARPQTEELSDTKKMFAEGPDRAAVAEAKSRATQAEIDAELKRYKNKTKGANDRAAVLNKDMWAAGPTVVNETSAQTRARNTPAPENAARMTAAQKAAAKQAADMEAFNSMLREQKVGPAVEEGKRIKARGMAGKAGLALTALGLGSAANAATNMTAGERERLGADVVEGLITPLGLTPSMAGEGSDLYPSKPLSSAERKKMIEAMSPADRKKMEEALARQNPGLLDRIKRPSAANQRAAGGQIKAKKMASGGMTSTVSSASKRGDGIASKGKTRCKMY